jgi:two-component sensor histidine kinase
LEDICAQINTVGSLHRSLATKGRDEFADLGEHLHEICTPFRSELSGPVKLSENFQRGCVVRLEQILPVSQIVAEVLTNAVKHARADSKAGAILTRCGKDATGAMQVEVIDDGPGLPPNFNPKTDGGLGFRLLRALGKQLNAPMTFESSSHGLHFCLTLPPDPVKQALPGKLLSN